MIWRAMALGALTSVPAAAQVAPGPARPLADTLHLADVRAAAERRDPRNGQREVLSGAARRRLENLRAERLPGITVAGQAILQDDVAAIPIAVPGIDLPRPPHGQYRFQLDAEQVLYDGGRLARRGEIERARLAESLAGVDATLLASRNAATELFFAALLLQSRIESLDVALRELESRLELARARVAAGAALGADAAMMEAELIRVRQQRADMDAEREATLEILSDRIGRQVTPDHVLALPLEIADAPVGSPYRPELERLGFASERSRAEARLAAAGARPDVRLFGQAGLGRPDPFVPFDDETDVFGVIGVRVRWNVLDWGRARRDAEIASAQATVAELDAEALQADFLRAAGADLAEAHALNAAWDQDERAVGLREEVVRVARVQFDEGVLLAADYLARVNELLEARLTRDRRRIESLFAYARALSVLNRFPGERPVHP